MAENLSIYTIKPLGVQLVETGLVSAEQLKQALAIQKQSPDKLLGQILVDMGTLDETAFQSFMKARTTIPQPLGELLVQLGHIQRSQLEAALSIQLQSVQPRALGQVLVEMKAISDEKLSSILHIQHQEREKIRETMQLSSAVQETQLIKPTRTQVEDVQGLLVVGHLLYILSKALVPDSSILEKRFYIFHDLYGNLAGELSATLLPTITDFFIHFSPILELAGDSRNEAHIQIVDKSFHALLVGFQKLLGDKRPIPLTIHLNSLVAEAGRHTSSLRAALYIIMRSPALVPHPSLQTLRFLFNEFWGQRSILEQQGVKIVRDEDEVDLEDFFRAQMGNITSDLQYMERMELHIFSQIKQTTEHILQSTDTDLEHDIHDLIEFYRTLLQTHKETRGLSTIRERDEEEAG